jgi:hypothetical protein
LVGWHGTHAGSDCGIALSGIIKVVLTGDIWSEGCQSGNTLHSIFVAPDPRTNFCEACRAEDAFGFSDAARRDISASKDFGPAPHLIPVSFESVAKSVERQAYVPQPIYAGATVDRRPNRTGARKIRVVECSWSNGSEKNGGYHGINDCTVGR